MKIIDFFNKTMDTMALCTKTLFTDDYNRGRMKGEIFFDIYDNDVLIERKHIKNIVTETASVFLARLMKDPTEPLTGVFALGVGTGSPTWDYMNPPPATESQVYLVNELARVEFSSINFVKTDGSGEVSTVPTYVLDCTAQFPQTIASGPWMEIGVFGDVPEPLTPNTGSMLTYRTFAVVNKSPTMSITITYRLSF